MLFYVIKYDVLSFERDATYHKVEVAAPAIAFGPASVEEATAKMNELNQNAGGETVECVLKNDQPYSGPRYIYRLGDADGNLEEVNNAQ